LIHEKQRPILPDEVRNHRLLMQGWSRLVRRLPHLELRVFGDAGGYPLLLIESRRRMPGALSVYLSAGIHGDEPAGVEGLLRWAERDLPHAGELNWQIFPCLNPWGLERNIRFDAGGRDLNRCYNVRGVPQITAQLAAMKGWRHDLAIMLHEDYDARGFYLYEISARRPHWGEDLIHSVTSILSPDTRRTIDGHRARGGLIRRRISPAMIKGHPEAFRLHFRHAARTLTIETPSEKSLETRVRLHAEFLSAAVKKLKLGVASR
jgi:hypothetical protein